MQHGVMLDARGDHVIAGGDPSRDGEVIAFRSTTGKHDLRAGTAKQLGDGFPRVLDRSPRFLSVMMDGRSVPEALPEERAHGLEHLRQNRGSGVVVEVNAVHKDPTSILRDLKPQRRRPRDTQKTDSKRSSATSAVFLANSEVTSF